MDKELGKRGNGGGGGGGYKLFKRVCRPDPDSEFPIACFLSIFELYISLTIFQTKTNANTEHIALDL
jgi:hypothetical protein